MDINCSKSVPTLVFTCTYLCVLVIVQNRMKSAFLPILKHLWKPLKIHLCEICDVEF